MFGNKHFEPWVGSHYSHSEPRFSEPRLLVIGESRFSDDHTDRDIIKWHVDGNRHATFTKFVQAATGLRHWEPGYDAPGFWHQAIFFNFNAEWFAGGPREYLPWVERMNQQNARLLREALHQWQPTHAVVWGVANWHSVAIEGEEWSEELKIPGTAEPYCPTSGFTTLFTRVNHPSCGFNHGRWAPMLKTFFAMRVPMSRQV
jgi:hypothetical protein